MSGLARYSQNDYKKIATTLRNKQRNLEASKERAVKRGGALVAGLAAAGAAGYAMGKLQQKGETDQTLGGANDPTKLGGFLPYPIAVGGALALFDVLGVKLTKKAKSAWMNEIPGSMGSHIVAGYAYQKAFEQGKQA